MPREQAWDYLIQPEFRNALIGKDRMEITKPTGPINCPTSVNPGKTLSLFGFGLHHLLVDQESINPGPYR